MFEKYLQDIGLSEKEAAVYLALLAVDNASVVALAQKTKIKRPTVYVTLSLLAKKGLVSEAPIGKKTHYHAEPPERLHTFVEQRKIVLEEQAEKLKDIIPQIKSIQRESGERPVVKYFEGKDGVLSSLEEFVESEDTEGTMYLVYPRDLLEEIFTDADRKRYRGIRLNKHIKSNALYTYKKGDIPSDATGERIKIDGEKYPISCDIAMYKDRVRINILGEKLSGVFIRSKNFAETMQSIFRLAFENIKKTQS
jgi:sugar-specific transcriptional regulator TrmB